MRYLLIILILSGCEFMHENFSIPDPRYRGTVILHTIHKGEKKSDQRSPRPVYGQGVKFNFNFQQVCVPTDSSVQKLYGVSDAWSNHLEYSPRLGFRIRQDSSIDIFAFWHLDDKDFVEISVDDGPRFNRKNNRTDEGNSLWLGNIPLQEQDVFGKPLFQYGAVEIERHFYEFRLGNKVVRVYGRTKQWLWGPKYGLFPWWEDENGMGATGDVRIAIEQL